MSLRGPEMTILVGDVFRSLKSFNYRLWAAGALVSNVGTWMQQAAQDWLVLTQLTNHSASAVGVVTALQLGPQLLFLPFTGFAADHLNRLKLLMATQAAMSILALILGTFTVVGLIQLWQVYVIAFLSGTVAAFDAPVRLTFVAELVGDDDLPNATALNSTSTNVARMVGPAVAGVTIAAIGTGWAFVFNGVSFGAVLISLRLLRPTTLHSKARPARSKGSLFEGFRYAWARPDLKAVLLMLFLIGSFSMNFPIFISAMAVNVFHTDARGFGLLSSTMAIGTLSGALVAAGQNRPGFGSLMLSASVFGLGSVLAAFAPGYWLFAGALAVMGVAAIIFQVATSSLMQLSTEPSMRGRIMALRLAVYLGGTPIGSPIVGWVADHCGPRWALGLGAGSGFAAAAVAARFIFVSRTKSPNLSDSIEKPQIDSDEDGVQTAVKPLGHNLDDVAS